MPRHRTASFKQKQFAKKYVEHKGNGVVAALESYDGDYNSAQVIASENLQKPVVINEINKILEKKGLNDDEYIAEKMTQALESGIGNKASNSDAIRILDMMLKLKNTYPASKKMNVNLNVNSSPATKNINELKEDLTKLQETTSKLLKDFQS